VFIEKLDHVAHCLRPDHHVGIDEEKDVSLRLAASIVSGGGRSRILGHLEKSPPHLAGHGRRIIRRSIIDNDDLRAGKGHGLQGAEALGKIPGTVVYRDNNRDSDRGLMLLTFTYYYIF
jgi:hypothetical protein